MSKKSLIFTGHMSVVCHYRVSGYCFSVLRYFMNVCSFSPYLSYKACFLELSSLNKSASIACSSIPGPTPGIICSASCLMSYWKTLPSLKTISDRGFFWWFSLPFKQDFLSSQACIFDVSSPPDATISSYISSLLSLSDRMSELRGQIV